MPVPAGVYAINGPIFDLTLRTLPASTALRDAGAVYVSGSAVYRVNAAGDAWEVIPGHEISATEPTAPFEGQVWYDTANSEVTVYDGSDFVPLGAGLTPEQLHALGLLQAVIDKTSDLEIREERVWEAATDADFLADTAEPTGPSLPNETYVTTFTYTAQNITERYLVLRIPHNGKPSSYRLLRTQATGVIHAIDGSHFAHLYTHGVYKYYGRRHDTNEVGDVLTMEKLVVDKETTAYLGNVEEAYPVPDLERLTDDMQVRLPAPTWTAGANNVDIGSFQGEPDLATLESHVWGDQLDFTQASVDNYTVIRVSTTMAVPQEVNAYRMVFNDTADNSLEYIRGAYFRFLYRGLLHNYYGRAFAAYDGLRLTLESSSVHGSSTLYQGNTQAFKVELESGIFFNLLSDQERTVQTALEILDETDAGRIRVNTTDFGGILGPGERNVQAALDVIDDNVIIVKHALSRPAVTSIADEDRDKIHVVEESNGNVLSVSYIEYVLSRLIFRMRTVAFQNQAGHDSHGWSIDTAENAGLFEPIGNLVRIYTNDSGTRRFNVHFSSEVVPHNHPNHNFIAIYYRVWGTTGDYYHRTCEKDATDTTYYISGGGHGQYFQADTEYEVHLRWGDRGNGSGPNVGATQELIAYPQNRRWRDIGTIDLFDGRLGVITQVVGRDSLDVFSLGTGVAANVNMLNFAGGLYSYLDPNNVGRPIVSMVPRQILPGASDGQVARWDSSTGYWEASNAPEGTDSENERILNVTTEIGYNGQDEVGDTWFSLTRRLRESDRGRLLLVDTRLDFASEDDTRAPFVPVLVDYLIDLPRTPWPGANGQAAVNAAFVQFHGPVRAGRGNSTNANWLLYYTGTVVTTVANNPGVNDLSIQVADNTDLSPGQVVYINDEAMRILSLSLGPPVMTVDRGWLNTTPTSHDAGDFVQIDDGLGWFMANTHTDQDALEELRMTLLGGLVNQETPPAFHRDILFEDATPRDTNGFESGLKLDLQMNRAPVPGSEMHIEFIVTRTVSGDDYEVTYPVEPFSSDRWLLLEPNVFGSNTAHDMMVMPIAVPSNGSGVIQTTQNSDNNIFIGRGTDNVSLYVASPQWGRYQDVTIRVREVLPNAGTSQAGGGTGTQQANVLLRRQVIAAPLDLTLNTGMDPSNFIPTEFVFGGVPKAGVVFFDAGVDVGGLFTIGPSVITQGTLGEIGYVENADWDWHLPEDRVPCIMLQTELGGAPHEPVIYHPQLRIITEAVTAGRPFVLAFFLSATGSSNITGVNFYAWSDTTDAFNLQHSAFTYEVA